MKQSIQLVADIGGSNARFAWLHSGSDELQGIEVFSCADYADVADVARQYMLGQGLVHVDKICLAVAGSVASDQVGLTNNPWTFSQSGLQQSFNAELMVINDFSAQMLSIDGLSDSELEWIGAAPASSSPSTQGLVRAALGPGTGLGVSAMLASGEILPSEAGHMAFAPVDGHELELLQQLWLRYDRVSIERVVSGPGLANLYWANSRLEGCERELSAVEVSAGARAGDKICLRAVSDFTAMLGSVAGDVALMTGASGGVYLAGGILPKILDLLDIGLLRQRFDSKGRFSTMCAEIPLAIVLAAQPGLRGCVRALATAQA